MLTPTVSSDQPLTLLIKLKISYLFYLLFWTQCRPLFGERADNC